MESTLFKQMLVFNPFDGVGETIDRKRQRDGHDSSLFSVE